MEWLIEVQKHHKQWITIVKTFGADDNAEDFVQEVYYRLAKFADKDKLFTDGKLNSSYMYFTLRNTYIMHIRKHRGYTEKNKFITVHFEDWANANDLFINDKHNNQIKTQGRAYKEKILKQMWDNDIQDKNEIELKEHKHNIILDKINAEIKRWHWYDQMLFVEYVNTGKGIRTLAEESKISRSSIFQTLKNCKEKIRLAVGEDWQDYNNKDYELIKD